MKGFRIITGIYLLVTISIASQAQSRLKVSENHGDVFKATPDQVGFVVLKATKVNDGEVFKVTKVFAITHPS